MTIVYIQCVLTCMWSKSDVTCFTYISHMCFVSVNHDNYKSTSNKIINDNITKYEQSDESYEKYWFLWLKLYKKNIYSTVQNGPTKWYKMIQND